MGTYGWDDARKKADDAQVGGKFLKLEDDGDTAILVWLDKPYARDVVWNGETYLEADSDDGKAYLDNHPKKKPQFRASMNGLVLKRGNKNDKELKVVEPPEVQIFENGVNWFNDLCKIKEKYGLGIWAFELQRNGKAGDPKTTYSMLPDTKVDDINGLAEKIKAAKLHDLANPMSDNDDDSKSGSNGVISDEQKAELVAKLKALGRETLSEFLKAFEVEQIKALPSSKFDAAMKFCSDKSGDSEPEVDPFA